VANKWDLVEKDHARVKALKDAVAERFVFARRAPFLPISAKTGRGVARVFPELDGLAKRFAARITTGELNRVLRKAFDRQSPVGRSGRELKIRYAVQVRSEPPAIRLFADRAEALHFSFERYLQNRLREFLKLDGVPLKFEVRKSD